MQQVTSTQEVRLIKTGKKRPHITGSNLIKITESVPTTSFKALLIKSIAVRSPANRNSLFNTTNYLYTKMTVLGFAIWNSPYISREETVYNGLNY